MVGSCLIVGCCMEDGFCAGPCVVSCSGVVSWFFVVLVGNSIVLGCFRGIVLAGVAVVVIIVVVCLGFVLILVVVFLLGHFVVVVLVVIVVFVV